MISFLYFARIDVVPDPGHPRFYDLDSGELELYFFADSDGDALARANAFPKVVRWELRKVVKIARVGMAQEDPIVAELIAEAKEIGIAWRSLGIPTGRDPDCQPPASKSPEGKE